MRAVVVSLFAGLLFVVPVGAAQAAKSCPAPAYPSANGNYTTSSITAKKVTCANVDKLLTKHYQCRVKNGASGRCVKLVMHFACREERYSDFYDSYFTATVTCVHEHQKVVWGYNQDKTTP